MEGSYILIFKSYTASDLASKFRALPVSSHNSDAREIIIYLFFTHLLFFNFILRFPSFFSSWHLANCSVFHNLVSGAALIHFIVDLICKFGPNHTFEANVSC